MNEESWDQISGGKGPFPYLGYTHLSVTVKLTENQPEISPFFFCRSELSDLISSSLSCNNDAVLTKSNERQKPRLQVKGNKCRTCVCVCGTLVLLQLEGFVVLLQGVRLFGERNVSRLHLLQQPLRLIEPAEQNCHTSARPNKPAQSFISTAWNKVLLYTCYKIISLRRKQSRTVLVKSAAVITDQDCGL